MDLRDVIEKLEVAPGYMLSVSLIDSEKNIEHILITENFQLLDMLPSHEQAKGLIVKELEQSSLTNRNNIRFGTE